MSSEQKRVERAKRWAVITKDGDILPFLTKEAAEHEEPLYDGARVAMIREHLPTDPDPAAVQRVVEVAKSIEMVCDTVEHIAEYWNGRDNSSATLDACTHMQEAAERALPAVEIVRSALDQPAAKAGDLRCPPHIETATGTFDGNGPGPDDCAGCGAKKADHISAQPAPDPESAESVAERWADEIRKSREAVHVMPARFITADRAARDAGWQAKVDGLNAQLKGDKAELLATLRNRTARIAELESKLAALDEKDREITNLEENIRREEHSHLRTIERADRAESQLKAKDAEIARLREAAGDTLTALDDAVRNNEISEADWGFVMPRLRAALTTTPATTRTDGAGHPAEGRM